MSTISREKSQQQLLAILAVRPANAAELMKRLDISQASLSRLLTSLGTSVLTIGKARSTIYARPRNIRGMGHEFPVYQVDKDGNARIAGKLYSVWEASYFWEPAEDGPPVLYRDLPWFIRDMCPEGFVGRAFAHRQHQDMNLPPRLMDWNNDHMLIALSYHGEDCMGNLILGHESITRYFEAVASARQIMDLSERAIEYPRLAEKAIAGDPAGSSAGGEQPKFTAIIKDGDVHHVLVKFSPGMDTEEGQRWADLLICESIASEVIAASGILAAESMILQAGDRTFLEVRRFDRIGLSGRLPMNSLGAVDNEFVGQGSNWVTMANRLEAERLLSPGDGSAIRWLSLFGDLIGNTDQHFGNISLIPAGLSHKRFSLAPAYDMLPMLYRPKEGRGTKPEFTPRQTPAALEWASALDAALRFWGQVVNDSRISEEFRRTCSGNIETLRALQGGPRLISLSEGAEPVSGQRSR